MSFSSGRSKALRQLQRLIRIAHEADRKGMPSREAVEIAREREQAAFSRRTFLGGMAAASALALTSRKGFAAPKPPAVGDVAIVGAGLAGLQCAYDLSRRGVNATIYEASSRVGGRQFTLRNFFPGQVAERGGEFIDTSHKTMLGWVNRLGLTREDVVKVPGEIAYYFNGQHVQESTIVDEYRDFVAAMHDDLQASSGAPTADNHNQGDIDLDNTTLAEYLVSRGAGPTIKKAIDEAYVAEYGRECSEQSSLNFLLFIHADKRSKFTPFGVFSDERFHVVEGNDRIATGIAGLLAKQPELGMSLVAVKKTAAGRIELTFKKGNTTVVKTHDRVVFALPFSVLRTVALDASLALPDWKRYAIDQLGYGYNAKMMLGFKGPYWAALGSNGTSYSDLVNHQTTWETNPALATTARAVLTDYSGGNRGKNLSTNVQAEAGKFLADLDKVFPGALANVAKSGNNYLAHLEHWPSNPLTRGSYTCYLPGQFTSLGGNEGKRVGNLYFAGEHADSFYSYQGFMEGALLSGIATAAEVLAR
jgi:monoamine oxidase